MNNVTNIIKFWQENNKFYDLLKNNMGRNINLIIKDTNCLSLGLIKYDYLTKYQQCYDCKILSSFLFDPILYNNDEIEVKFGKFRGEKIIFDRYDYQSFDIILDNKQKNINNYINLEINKFIINNNHNNIYYYQIKQCYLNLAVINTILKRIAKAKNFPTPNKFLHFYLCRDKIILLRFKYDIEHTKELLNNPLFISHLSPVSKKKKNNYLTSNIILDIFKQLVVFFIFYERFNFCHNQGSIEFIKINCELNNFYFLDKEIISPIKLFLLPSKYSSISLYNSEKDEWSRFSYYRHEDKNYSNLIESWYIDWDGVDKKERKTSAYSVPAFEKGKIVYYCIGRQADKFLYFRRHMSNSIFCHSFDLICFLISLMIENYIYVTVKNNNKLNKLWSDLWLKEELEDLEKDILGCKKNNFDSVFRIIRKYYLRVDALDYMKKIL
jgi:hypothetical protein